MRRHVDVTVSPDNAPSAVRDHFWPNTNPPQPKVFRITEMSAFDAEAWGMRATLALIPRLSREVSPEVAEEIQENAGMLSTTKVGMLLGGIQFPELRELLAELMAKCVRVLTDPSGRLEPRPLGVGGAEDIEEVETIHLLREEALRLHTGFTFAAAVLNLVAALSRTSPSEITSTSRP